MKRSLKNRIARLEKAATTTEGISQWAIDAAKQEVESKRTVAEWMDGIYGKPAPDSSRSRPETGPLTKDEIMERAAKLAQDYSTEAGYAFSKAELSKMLENVYRSKSWKRSIP